MNTPFLLPASPITNTGKRSLKFYFTSKSLWKVELKEVDVDAKQFLKFRFLKDPQSKGKVYCKSTMHGFQKNFSNKLSLS